MSKEASDLYRHVLLEYDNNLSRAAKLIFMDLALSDVCKLTTYFDLYPSWQWPECLKHLIAIHLISCVHDLSVEHAQTKVKELQEMSLLKESTTEVAIPDFYREFAWWLMKDDDRDEMTWYYWHRHRWCVPVNTVKWPETVTRVMMFQISMCEEDLHFQAFTKLVYLELERVEVVQELNLQGLRSLRVMKVKQCKDLKEIVCRCSSWWKFFSFYRTDNKCVGELRFVQLVDLPNLKSVSFALHCSNLKSSWIYDCPNLDVWYLLRTSKTLKRLALPSGFSDTMLKDLMRDEVPVGVLIMGLTTLVIQRGHDQVVIKEETAKCYLKSMMEHGINLRVLDIGDVIPASIGSIESINVSKLVHLTILDLSGAKMTRIEELCKLQNLHALGLYGCSELLTLLNLDIFTELRKLCISHCHKLAKTFSNEAVPHGVGNFHALGDKCNFDDHECLNPGW